MPSSEATQLTEWLKAWIASALAHQRRHLAQALRVTLSPGFPA